MRIAFATGDGRVADQHFGQTPSFDIVEVNTDDYTWAYIETRANSAAHGGESDKHGQVETGIAAIVDCDVVIAARVGVHVQRLLTPRGIQVLEQTGVISDLTERYILYLKRQRQLAQRRGADAENLKGDK
ncbi:MAG: dinitrogenase iron-molybdenum cofactor [Oscillospiraceae bacterium]|jgi:predicted Fe-Mo cluster-binding NifX family protein|nr:dinitrogenase iron-molybdenum cofactor [Oscillospiraceae bacterium]